jgi:hypothetical protein
VIPVLARKVGAVVGLHGRSKGARLERGPKARLEIAQIVLFACSNRSLYSRKNACKVATSVFSFFAASRALPCVMYPLFVGHAQILTRLPFANDEVCEN